MSDSADAVPGGLEVIWVEAAGARLRAAVAPPLEGGRTLFLFTGRTEFLEKYEDVFAELRRRGFRVVAWEWRGQGASDRLLADPRRGHISDYGDFQHDLDAVIATVGSRLAQPFYALAHSMGGLILTRRLQAAPSTFARAALCAPLFGVMMSPFARPLAPAMAALAVRMGFGGAYAPGQGPAPLAGDEPVGNVLTTDHDRFKLYRRRCRAHDELMLGGVTWGWLDATFRAFAELHAPGALEAVTTPLLLLEAGNERVVDPGAIHAAMRRLPAAHKLILAGAEHEILMERDAIRNEALDAIDAFLR